MGLGVTLPVPTARRTTRSFRRESARTPRDPMARFRRGDERLLVADVHDSRRPVSTRAAFKSARPPASTPMALRWPKASRTKSTAAASLESA